MVCGRHTKATRRRGGSIIRSALALGGISAGMAGSLEAQPINLFAGPSGPSPVQFYGPNPFANAIREVIYVQTASFLRGRNSEFVLTSGHRPREGGANPSAAHADGAVDFVSNTASARDRHGEAAGLSATLGPDFTVVVEEGFQPFGGRSGGTFVGVVVTPFRTLTSYRNGKLVSVGFDKFRPTHTHVQRARGLTAAALALKLGLTPVSGPSETYGRLISPNYITSLRMPQLGWRYLEFSSTEELAEKILNGILSGSAPNSGTLGAGARSGLGLGGAGPGGVMPNAPIINMPPVTITPNLNLPPITVTRPIIP
jgi:hypothetical protein